MTRPTLPPRFNVLTLQRFNPSTLQPFNASTLQRFNASTLQPFNASTLQRFNASTLQRFNASTLQRPILSPPQQLRQVQQIVRQPVEVIEHVLGGELQREPEHREAADDAEGEAHDEHVHLG